LTKTNYLNSIKKGGFQSVEALEEKPYIDNRADNERRRISSIVVKAVKD
jgi:hypothetical protein